MSAALPSGYRHNTPVDLAVVEEVSNIRLAGRAGLHHLLHPKGPSSLGPSVDHITLPLYIQVTHYIQHNPDSGSLDQACDVCDLS